MVFLIQAIQSKLVEIIRANQGAPVGLLNLEDLTDEDLATIRKGYGRLAELARGHLAQGGSDTDAPEIEHGRVK